MNCSTEWTVSSEVLGVRSDFTVTFIEKVVRSTPSFTIA